MATDSICDTCRNVRNTWGEGLREDHRGCVLLMLYDDSHPSGNFINGLPVPRTAEEAMDNIQSAVFGTGWIVSGAGGAFNEQIITSGTTHCRYHQFKSPR